MRRIIPMIISVIMMLSSALPTIIANAETNEEEIIYSGVLEDLQKDESFDIGIYPESDKDYSLDVIQVAESENRELFVYVYSPSQKAATSINISQYVGDNLSPRNYDLVLLNMEGTLGKYKVSGLTLFSDMVRYYWVISIFRNWEKEIDKGTGNDNEIAEVSYGVGRLYTVCTTSEGVTYSEQHKEEELVKVEDKYTDHLRYTNGLFGSDPCDSWYVAFRTDREIELLMAADVQYNIRSKEHLHFNSGDPLYRDSYSYGEWKTVVTSLSSMESHSNVADGWFAKKYTWQEIESIEEFLDENDGELLDSTLSNLANKKWILRFAQTTYSIEGQYDPVFSGLNRYTERSSDIDEVTILRLYFETEGKVYNVGVVDNKQSPDDQPGNKWHYDESEGCAASSCASLWSIIGIILVIVLIILCLPLIRNLVELIVWIIGLPFNAIKKRKRKKDEDESEE